MSMKFIFLAILIVTISCQYKEKDKSPYVIVGNVANIPASKVYLSQANYVHEYLDSTEYSNGQFKFELDRRKFKEPFLASISFLDDKKKIQQLLFINYKTTTSKDTFANTGCFLENPITTFEGDYRERYHRVKVKPGKENDLFFDPAYNTFGWLGGKNRLLNLRKVTDTIFQHRNSYFLLSNLYEYRGNYTSNEIEYLLLVFDQEVRDTPKAKRLKKYADNQLLSKDSIPNVEVLNEDFLKERILDSSSNLTMVIFWASWCGPCRQEIPQLKQIFKKYSPKGLKMLSVSIDRDSKDWLKALNQEKMPWNQYLVDTTLDADKLFDQFRLGAVPLTIFIGRDQKQIRRFVGFDESIVSEYSKVIEQNLNRKKE